MGDTRLDATGLRIFIGLTEISGYARNLAIGFRTLGGRADLLDLNPPFYRFGEDKPPTFLMRALQRVARARASAPRASLGKVAFKTAQLMLTPVVFVESLLRYDVFVFLYDATFLGYRELALMRLLGKRVIYVFCGSDVRPPYMDGGVMAASRGSSFESCIAGVRSRQRMLRIVERHATAIVGHPSYAQLHRRPFVSFLEIGIPRALGSPVAGLPDRTGPPVVIHAPSHPEAKGSRVVRETMARLRDRGLEFIYDEVQGVPNGVLLERLQRADLVVDMVWGDTPMDGLAADAAWFGCPTVIGGYGWSELRSLTPGDAFPPSECCAPEELEDAIAALLVDPARRRELGEAARHYVTTRWSAEIVAERFMRLLEGEPPAEWLCDPSALRYVLGWGQPASRTRELVTGVVARAGVSALGLADKPEAERLLLDVARDGAHQLMGSE